MGYNQYVRIDDFKDPVARSHLYRYYSARGFIKPEDIVIDAACGVGYGTELLAAVAKKAIGIDRDIEAIKYAMMNHKKENNYFVAGNLDQMEKFPDCDAVVSIETLEHLRFPQSFVTKIKMAAKRLIYLSCPIVPTKHQDATHLNDFTEGSILEMFEDDTWRCIDSATQGPYLLIAFYRK